MKSTILILGIIVLFIGCSNSGDPAPYSRVAFDKLFLSVQNLSQPVVRPDAKASERLEKTVNYANELYSTAGYSFDASVIQLSKDLTINPSFLYQDISGVAQMTHMYVHILSTLSKGASLALDDYVDNDTAEAIITISRVIKE